MRGCFIKVAKEGLSEVNKMKMAQEGNDSVRVSQAGEQQVYKP